MDAGRKSIYTDLERRLNGFPVGDFVREYAKAYLEADVETIRKLQELLLRHEICIDDSPNWDEPESHIGAPIKPRPHLSPGAIALPEPDDSHL